MSIVSPYSIYIVGTLDPERTTDIDWLKRKVNIKPHVCHICVSLQLYNHSNNKMLFFFKSWKVEYCP